MRTSSLVCLSAPSYTSLFLSGLRSLRDRGLSSVLRDRASNAQSRVQEEADAHRLFLCLSLHQGTASLRDQRVRRGGKGFGAKGFGARFVGADGRSGGGGTGAVNGATGDAGGGRDAVSAAPLNRATSDGGDKTMADDDGSRALDDDSDAEIDADVERIVSEAVSKVERMSRHAVIHACMKLAWAQVEPQLSLFRAADESLCEELGPGVIPSPALRLSHLRERTLSSLGWTIERGPSSLPGAGVGVFARGDVPVGAVLGFYPGVVYTPRHHTSIPNYPEITADNDYLIMRYDRTVIDAKCRDASALARLREMCGQGSVRAGNDPSVPFVADTLAAHEPALTRLGDLATASHPLGDDEATAHLELNPHALAHLVNHPGTTAPRGKASGADNGDVEPTEPNALGFQFNFPGSLPAPLSPYVPNRYHDRPGVVDSLRWPEVPTVRGYVLVCTEPIADGEEVLVDYRLHPGAPRPEWYAPVDGDAERRRWGVDAP